MTIQEINTALGQEWFSNSNPSNCIVYSDEDDVEIINLAMVIHVREVGDAREIFEYVGEGDLPNEFTPEMENGEDDDVKCHALDKWQARGASALLIKSQDVNPTFYPEQCGLTKSRILELINNEVEDEIEMDDPRLTNELCQEIANDWAQEDMFEGCTGDLWDTGDDLADEWIEKLNKTFKPE